MIAFEDFGLIKKKKNQMQLPQPLFHNNVTKDPVRPDPAIHPPMSQAVPAPQSLLRLSYNNEVTFHSDAAAGGLWAQRVIKGLVALISSDLLGDGCPHSVPAQRLPAMLMHHGAAAATPIPLTEATGIAWTRLIQI